VKITLCPVIRAIALNGRNRRSDLSFSESSSAPTKAPLENAVQVLTPGRSQRAKFEAIAHGLVDLYAFAPLVRRQVLFQRQFTDKLHDAIFDDIGFNADP